MKKEEVEAMEGRLAEMSRRIDALKERLGTARGHRVTAW